MKQLVLVLVILLLPAIGGATPNVTVDPGECIVWDGLPTIQPFQQYEFTVWITNPDQLQDRCVVPLAFVMTGGAPLDDPTVNYYLGFDTLFGVQPDFAVEHHGDTVLAVVSVIASEPGRGLPISSDSLGYFSLTITAPGYASLGAYLVIDTASSSTYGGLQFGAGASPWCGIPLSYEVVMLPNSPDAQFTNCPQGWEMPTPMCAPFIWDFNANTNFGDRSIVGFHILEGPGEIDEFSGYYSWTPGPADVGTVRTLRVVADGKVCVADLPFDWTGGEVCEMTIAVTGENRPPQFATEQPRVYSVVPGEELIIQPLVDDSDACTDYRFSYYWDTLQDPEPPGWMDSLSGAFHFEGTPADTGVYYVSIVVSELNQADTMGVYIYDFDSYICGDINHYSGINVSDLTWLTAYLFQGGLPPVTLEAGNVDCQPGVNVSDLTYLVGFLFQGGAAPCASCP